MVFFDLIIDKIKNNKKIPNLYICYIGHDESIKLNLLPISQNINIKQITFNNCFFDLDLDGYNLLCEFINTNESIETLKIKGR